MHRSSWLAALLCALLSTSGAQSQTNAELLCDPKTHPAWKHRQQLRDLAALLQAKRFAALNTSLAKIRSQGREPGTYLRRFESVLDWLAKAVPLDVQDEWCKAEPKSDLPRLIRGKSLIAHAWAARGGGYASTVNEEGWKTFGKLLRRAKADLIEAHQRAPAYPQAATLMITVCMGLSLPEAEARAWFKKATAAGKLFDLHAHSRLLTYLLPKWHGTLEKAADVAERAAKAYPDDVAVNRLFLEIHKQVHQMTRRRPTPHFKNPAVQKEVIRLARQVLKVYPRAIDTRRILLDMLLLQGGTASKNPAALKQWAALAEHGYATAQFQWARYLLGVYAGVEAKPRLGLRFLCRAAHNGHVKAQLELGEMLLLGNRHGLQRDLDGAYHWHMQAAQGGHFKTFDVVGQAFYRGDRFVAKNLPKARETFALGARSGHLESTWNYGRMLLKGEGGPKDERKGMELIRLAATNKHGRASLELARRSSKPAAQAKWYRIAIRLGQKPAVAELKQLLAKQPSLRQPEDP